MCAKYVGCEEGVLYRTFAGQPVDFKFAIVGGTSVKEAETGSMVRASVKREDQQESQDLPLVSSLNFVIMLA